MKVSLRPLALLGRGALDLLYPERCLGCGAFGTLVCSPCHERLDTVPTEGRCPHCSALWDGDLNCPRCFGWRYVDGVRAPFEMAGLPRRLVHALKYQGVRGAAPIVAPYVASALAEARCDSAVAVPLHRSRERRRGFNQAHLILREIETAVLPGRFRRIRNTRQQVGLDSNDRRRNVGDAFAYEGDDLEGASVALVDDVVTTGATAEACARVLLEHGASRVVAVTFARASYDIEQGPRRAGD